MTAAELARELEVSSRTILRDVEAMTEAGLPVIVHQGNRGGIELGFNYRMRLTGLTTEEADALGVILSLPLHELEALGLRRAGHMALSKIRELLPAPIRGRTDQTAGQFSVMAEPPLQDIRIPAMADAVRRRCIVRLHAKSAVPREIHPVHLSLGAGEALVTDRAAPEAPIGIADWGDINISSKCFE